MALQTPLYLQSGSYSARIDRLSLLGLIVEKQGVAGRNDLVLTASTPNAMSVQIGSGTGIIKGSLISQQGHYVVTNIGAASVTIGTSHPSLPRVDVVILRVKDAEVSGNENTATFEVVQGTPAAVPMPPTIPPMSINLGQVHVAAGATSISNSNIFYTVYRERASYRRDMGGGFVIVANRGEQHSLITHSGPSTITPDNPLITLRLDAPRDSMLEICRNGILGTTDDYEGDHFEPLTAVRSTQEFPAVMAWNSEPGVPGTSPYEIGYIDIPYEGVPYYITAQGSCYMGALNANEAPWELLLLLRYKGKDYTLDSYRHPNGTYRSHGKVFQTTPYGVSGSLKESSRIVLRMARTGKTGSGTSGYFSIYGRKLNAVRHPATN